MTSEDTEEEVHKYFLRKSFGNFTRKTSVLKSPFKSVGDP